MSKTRNGLSRIWSKSEENRVSHFITFSIQSKLFVSSAIITLLVIATVFYVFQNFILELVADQQAAFTLNTYAYANQTIKSLCDEMEVNIKGINNNEIIMNTFKNKADFEDYSQIGNTMNQIDSEINRSLLRQDVINNIVIVGVNNFAYTYLKNYKGKYLGKIIKFDKFYAKISSLLKLNTSESMPVYPVFPESLQAGDSVESDIYRILNNQVVLIRTLKDYSNEITGFIAITMNAETFFKPFSENDGSQTLLIIDEHKHAIWSNKNAKEYGSLLGETELHNDDYQIKTVNNKKVMNIKHDLQPFQVQILSSIPFNNIVAKSTKLKQLIGIFGIVCILFVLFISYIYSKKISAPINGLLGKLLIDFETGIKKVIPPLILNHNRKSLRKRLIFFFLLSTIIPNLIFISLSLNNFYKFYREKVIYYTSNTLKLVINYMDSNLEEYDLAMRQLIFNQDIQKILQKSLSQHLLKEDKDFVGNQMINFKNDRKERINLILYNSKGDLVYSTEYFSMNNNNLSINGLKKTLDKSHGELNYIGIDKNYPGPEMYFARKINSIDSYNLGSTLGYIKIGIASDTLEKMVSKAREDIPSHIAIFDSKMNYITFDDLVSEQLVSNGRGDLKKSLEGEYSSSYKGHKFTVITKNGKQYNIGYIKIVSEDDLRQKLLPFYGYSLIVVFLIFGLIIATTIAIYKSILNPLKRLLSDMQDTVREGGDFIGTRVLAKDEISYISVKINELIGEMNGLLHENYNAKIREKEILLLQKEAELEMLQGQINPHFLYNTLESINWVAYKAGVSDICDMVSALGRFFRGGLSSSKTIPIMDEIKHLNDYIYLQEVRYKGRLQFTLNIKEEILLFMTLKLVLQPIVENAVIHGVDHLKEGGKILIKGYRRKDYIILAVKDNGAGMSEERLKEVLEKLENRLEHTASIGLRNVNHRIKLYFGESFGIQIKSKAGKGTLVRLIFPVMG